MTTRALARAFAATARETLLLASAEPLGLLVFCSDPAAVRAKLYAERKAALDPELDRLQFRIVDFDGGNLAITKGRPKSQDSAS